MLVTKDKSFEHKVKTDMDFLTWSSEDKGKIDETVLHTLIEPGASLTITTPEGVTVEFKESSGDVRKDVELLANAKGLEWMGDLLERDDVDWQAVQEIHDQWSKSDGGLGAGGMLIISLIASAVTAGAASGLAMAAMGMEMAMVNGVSTMVVAGTTTAASTAQVAMCTALTAAFTSIASEAGLKSLTTAMISAGIASEFAQNVDSIATAGEGAFELDLFYTDLANSLQDNVIRAGINTGIGTVVNGGNLNENLVANMRGAAVSTLGAQGASLIGTAYKDQDINKATQYIAHAALGGALDLASGGNGASCAISAVTGELIGDTFVSAWISNRIEDSKDMGKLSGEKLQAELNKLTSDIAELKRHGVNVARLGAGMAAALAGGDVDIAAQTGGNAAENNALPLVLVIYGACEAVDAGVKMYNAYKLAEAIQNQDEEAIKYYSTEILIDTAVDAAPPRSSLHQARHDQNRLDDC